ncbi:hypothetical protein MNBD_NITROSPINAE04-2543 [hydrothermal vent metagenome]|uniref:Uncharacterized protein n=1 Tax=hydrothermal vent metagenome TaxID=652676 RepID=A0A3B1C9Q0_9ZZZZ
MENIDGFIVFLHVVVGAIFAITVTVVQLVVAPAMKQIPAGEGKLKAVAVIQGRAARAMDIAIILQSLTAVYLLITRWEMISASAYLHVKISLGIIALVTANLLHFYWRGKKARLKAEGKMDEFKALAGRTLFFEKVVLVTAPATFLMGVAFNHL